jgi:peptidoglycan/LPS O-acetylase OafA/YrhL
MTVTSPTGLSSVALTGPRRIATLDTLRGIAALLVVGHHAHYFLQPQWGQGVQWLLHVSPLRIIDDGRPPVIFFFVLSGYVLALALRREQGMPSLLRWGLRRSLRLLLPVAASVVFSAILFWLFAQPYKPSGLGAMVEASWHAPPDARNILQHFLLLDAQDGFDLNRVLWSLVHEWRISLVLPFVLLFRGRLALLLGLTLLLRSLAISAGAPEDRAFLGPHLRSTLVATAYFVFPFAAGAALALHGPGLVLSGSARLGAWAAVAAATVLASDLAVILASVLLILLLRDGVGLSGRILNAVPLRWLGRISFSLYLVHAPISLALAHQLAGFWHPAAIAATAALLALPAADVFWRLVERPALWLSRSFAAQPRALACGV